MNYGLYLQIFLTSSVGYFHDYFTKCENVIFLDMVLSNLK